MIELLLHFSMTPMLIIVGYLCWLLALSKKMSSMYRNYEPKNKFFCFVYRGLLGFILVAAMNVPLIFYLLYSNWIYS